MIYAPPCIHQPLMNIFPHLLLVLFSFVTDMRINIHILYHNKQRCTLSVGATFNNYVELSVGSTTVHASGRRDFRAFVRRDALSIGAVFVHAFVRRDFQVSNSASTGQVFV